MKKRKESNDFSKRDIRNIIYLSFIYILIIFIIMEFGNNLYGSDVDWVNQHVTIPEYFRNRFYETGQLFPSFAFEIGGGQNIYYLAYYGLHSPFLLISYFMPFIEMKWFIIWFNIISIFASMWLFYYWIRAKYSTKVSFLTTLLFLTSAPLIFHSHRHIMFVDYMPFLILSLIIIRRNFKENKRLWPLAITSLCLITTSFYFSVGSFLVIGIYSIMLYLEEAQKFNLWSMIKRIFPVVRTATIGVLMSCIMLIPTACALILGRSETAKETVEAISLRPTVNMGAILYGTYSIGLTTFSLYAIIAAFYKKNKENIFMASILVALCVFPAVIYILNGGLYLDAKVLIPFLPIALLPTAQFIKSLFLKEKLMKSVIIVGTVLNIIIIFADSGKMTLREHLLEFIPTAICLLIYMIKRYSYVVCIPVGMVAVAACIILNLSDEIVEYDYREDVIDSKIEELVEAVIEESDTLYRFGNDEEMWRTVNKVYCPNYLQTTVYSSTSNPSYKSFYFDEMKNEVRYRNNAGVTTSQNVLFGMYMGVKYFISESAYIPIGYELADSNENIYLYESKEAYPIGYATSNVISGSEYKKLEYPYNTEALLKYAVVPDGEKILEDSLGYEKEKSAITRYDLKCKETGDIEQIESFDGGYKVELSKKQNITVDLEEPLEGKILFISFDVDNYYNMEKTQDVYITINGTKNKLTEYGWKYHNQNYRFEYVLSSNEELDSLDITFSSGYYKITDIKTYIMDYEKLVQVRQNIDEMYIDKDKTSGDDIYGSIDVTKDSWFSLSIPYDEGFSIYVDDKHCEYKKSDKGFIGFFIEEGVHNIHISYKAKGFDIGVYGSIIGLILFAVTMVYEEIKKKGCINK